VQKAGKLILHLLEEIEEIQNKRHHNHHNRHRRSSHEDSGSHEDRGSHEVLDDCEIQEKIMEKVQHIFMKWVSGKFYYLTLLKSSLKSNRRALYK